MPSGGASERTPPPVRSSRVGGLKILIVSPHYDDAPLSLGQSLMDGVLSDHEVTVGVIYGRSCYTRWFFPTPRRTRLATTIRQVEERVNARRFGYRRRWAKLEEAGLRLGSNHTDVILNPETDPRADPSFEEARALVTSWMADYDATIFPLSIGDHIDHRIATAIGLDLLDAGEMVSFFEDRPYINFTDTPTAELAHAVRPGLEARTVSGPITVEKYNTVWYPSQMTPLFYASLKQDDAEQQSEHLWTHPDRTWP